MGTIAEKLEKLSDTKAALKAAINGTGSTVGDVFADYPTAVSSGKAAIASAITAKGVTTPANATFSVLAANVAKIASGRGLFFGTAVSEQRGANLVLPTEFSNRDYKGFFAYTTSLNGGYNYIQSVLYYRDNNTDRFIATDSNGVNDDPGFALDGAENENYVNGFSMRFGPAGTEYTCILF